MPCGAMDRFGTHSTERTDEISQYILRQARKSARGAEDLELAKTSSTVYVGNLSFFTTEEQVLELFSKIGKVKRIIMGLDRLHETPCGFCFVEFEAHEQSLQALRYLDQTKLDDRIIKIDRDPGFVDGRQFGRGNSGGQVRDELREDYDPGRGGYGGRARR